MIDLTKPLMLDDGTPVEFIEVSGSGFKVMLPDDKSVARDPDASGFRGGSWFFYRDSGIFFGQGPKDRKFYRVVNKPALFDVTKYRRRLVL